VNSGASIAEINSVRRTFSAVKGGRLAARAPNCRQITLIVSDVPKRRERFVSSGPWLAPGTDDPSPAKVISRLNLRAQLPLSILDVVYKPSPPERPAVARRAHFVLLDNSSAVEAAFAEALGRRTTVSTATDVRDQPIEVGCEKLLETLKSRHNESAEVSGLHTCLISGGEFACPVRGNGIGGRNLETALRLAILAEQKRDQIGEFVALCAGTDGVDGNSPAAGAIIDSTTIERARKIGLDPNDFLNRSDSYSFFVALGDAIMTGPTGTNVRELRILLKACLYPDRYQGINSELKLQARSGRDHSGL
jgi:hydroxypyruvate reductase